MNVDIKLTDTEAAAFLAKRLKSPSSLDGAARYAKLLNDSASPQFVYRAFTPRYNAESVFLIEGGITVKGKDIRAHLDLCGKVYLLAATLGYGTDRLIAQLQLTDMSAALCVDMLAGELVEKVCDFVCAQIAAIENGPVTNRFSCGYGDFPLDSQEEILNALNAGKLLGVKLTNGGMMTPFKTVTAVVGAGKEAGFDRCGGCTKKNRCDKEGCI